MTSAYWVKCKAMREVKSPQSIIVNGGRHATTGRCQVCGTRLFNIEG